MFGNDLGDLGSIPGRVIPMTLKMVLDTSLLYTQQYKVRIKGKVEQYRVEHDVVAIEKGAFRLPSTKVANFYLEIIKSWYIWFGRKWAFHKKLFGVYLFMSD